ncbi:MAG: MATE family efflux transporter [Clostridiales bacterium]|nr:MATE family efflux transporter [Clostridiales bacterium]
MVRDMTKGKPLKLIVSFCVPILLGNVFQQFYNMVDSIVVGQFVGKGALAAVGSTGSLSFLILGFVGGICTGFSIPVAQSFGAGDHATMRRYLANIIYLCAFVAIVVTAITLLLTGWILRVMNTPEDIFKDAYTYIIIIFGGLSAIIFYNMLAAVLRAIGDSRTPLYFLILSALLNIALDLIFVILCSMGVMGVAIATVISQLVSGLLCLLHIKRHFYILHLRREDMKFDRKLCARLMYIGLPMGFQFSITAIGSIMLQSAVNSLGSDIVAAVTAAVKVQLMIVQPSEAIGITMATYCGQNLGAGEIERIRNGVRKGVEIGLIYSIMGFFIGHYAGKYIALLFLKKSEIAVLANVAFFLKYNSIFYPTLSLIFILRNTIQGLGYSVPAMLAGLVELIARGVFGFFMVPKFGFWAVCFAHPAAWIEADIVLIPVYIYVIRRLKSKKVEKYKKRC